MGPDALAGRLGGKEFGLIIPYASTASARHLCERLRRRVQGTEIDLPGRQDSPGREDWLHVTLSLGVAETKPHERPKDVIARADMALYGAKRSGRNQVMIAEELTDDQSVPASLLSAA
jgi:diguanylate cyclase (GGDEF)-like protein